MKKYYFKGNEELFNKWVDLEKINQNYSMICRVIIQNEGIIYENELYEWLDVVDNWLLDLEDTYSRKIISNISDLIEETRTYIESCEIK